jgi:hypothetical protein
MKDATLTALRAFPDQLEAHYALIPATHTHWAPPSWEGVPSEALTAIEQVCHVRDIEIEGYQYRFERTLAEEIPFLPSIDTEALARDRRYGESNAARASAARGVGVCSHDQQHLAGLQWLLGKIESGP